MKFPSQTKLMYVQDAAVSNDGWSQFSSGGVAGHLNLPKDLSILNRRGYASTNSKGTPLVYRCEVGLYATNYDGTGASAAVGSDFVTSLQLNVAQNNWVMKNASEMWQRALIAMRKKAGIKNNHVGTYAKTIRFGWNAAGDNWLIPIDGDGGAFTGGTWDYTRFADSQDSSFGLKLTGIGLDEDSAAGVTALQIGHSYLSRRRQPDTDSNEGTSETPAEYSHLMDILAPNSDERRDEVVAFTKDDGDNVPYEVFATETTNHDITEPVEAGRCLVGPGAQYSSMIVDIPFGIGDFRVQHYDAADTNTVHEPMITVDVLDIFEMQG